MGCPLARFRRRAGTPPAKCVVSNDDGDDKASADNAQSLRTKGPGAEGSAQACRASELEPHLLPQVWRDLTDVTDSDAELMAAIEAFRQRQLAKINAQLAEFGIEPPAPKTEEQKPNYFLMILGDEGWKRPTAT